MRSPFHRRDRAAAREARRPTVPGEHPVLLGAGAAGLLAVSMLWRRHGRDPRDEPVTLGIGF